MTFVWIIAVGVAVLLILDFLYRQYASRRICQLFENVPPFGVVRSHPVDSAQQLKIARTHGGELSASLHRPTVAPLGIIVFCPEVHGNQWTALNYCESLLNSGFIVLGFNFHGPNTAENGVPPHWVTEADIDDIAAVLTFVDAHPEFNQLPLGIFGVSRGGSAAILAACRFPQIKSVVTDSAYGTMGMVRNFVSRFSRHVVPNWIFERFPQWQIELTLWQAVRRSERKHGCRYVHLENEAHSFHQPVLLISGARDSYATQEVTHDLARWLKAEDSVWIVERAKHNKSRQIERDAYDDRIVRHFQQTLVGATEAQQPSTSSRESSLA